MPWPGTNEPTTAKELATYIDQDAWLNIEDLRVHVRIMDVRSSFGNVQFLVHPIGGLGQQWVGASRCKGYEPELREL